MKKRLVLYYSKTGNSRFLATKASELLECEVVEVKSSPGAIALMYLLSSLNFPVRTSIPGRKIDAYEEILLFGPVWGGLLIAPLRSVIRMCRKASKKLHFAVTCETSDEEKDDKYGYRQVLDAARKLGGQLVINTQAFPVTLVQDGAANKTIRLEEKTRITADNYPGRMEERLTEFVEQIKSNH
jgi:flavodoxin